VVALTIEQIMVELPARDGPATADSPREYPAGRAIGQEAPVRYDAFISYSHAKDKRIASALQSVVQKLGKAWYHRRALRVFRDDTSLSATPHLWPSIEEALRQSRFLILLASPGAAASRWVGQEIAYWLDHNSADTMLIALTEGQLDWDEAIGDFRWSEATPLPTALKNRFATEPRWIDLRSYRDGDTPKGGEFMGLGADFAAEIRGIRKEDLLSQEVRQQRRAMTLASAAAAALVVLLVAAGWQWNDARLQRNQAQFERDKARMQLLAMQARRTNAEATSPNDIERAAALALEGIEAAYKLNLPAEADAVEAARSALVRLPLLALARGSPVTSLAALPDGRLASASRDGKIRLWPKEGVGEPVVLSHGRENNDEVRSLAVLTDGRLVSGGMDGKIKIWPKEGMGEPKVLSHGTVTSQSGKEEFYPVTSLTVLPDGRLASAGFDFKIKLWPKDGGPPVVLSHSGVGPARSLAVLADGRLASAGDDGNIKIWPKEGGGEAVVFAHGNSVQSLTVLRDGRLASAGGQNGKIMIWPKEGDTGGPVVLWHGSVVNSLAVLADGRLASAGNDGNIKIWPKEFGEPVVLTHGLRVAALAVLADGRLASAGGDNIKIWPKEGTSEPLVRSHGSPIESLVVLTDKRLASAGDDGNINIWPTDDVGKPVILSHGNREVHSLAALADGRLASGGDEGEIKLWPKEGTGEPMILSNYGRVASLAVLADGQLASGGMDGKIRLWPQQPTVTPYSFSARPYVSGKSVVFFSYRSWAPTSLAVLADGGLASAGADGEIKLWPMPPRSWLSPLTRGPVILSHANAVWSHGVLVNQAAVDSLAALSDGRLASGGDNGKIKIWPKGGTGEPLILSHGYPVRSLAQLADGRLASGGDDGDIKLWPKEGTGEPVVLSHGSPVMSLVAVADGRLASGGRDGKIKLWLVDQQKLIAALCLRAGRNLTKDEWAHYIGADTPWQPSCRNRPSNWRTQDYDDSGPWNAIGR
jgi:WD40 repeat protein